MFDGGYLNTLDTVTLPPDELSDAAFVSLDQLSDYLPALQSRRAIVSVHARRAGTVAYLEDGRQTTTPDHPRSPQPRTTSGWPWA